MRKRVPGLNQLGSPQLRSWFVSVFGECESPAHQIGMASKLPPLGGFRINLTLAPFPRINQWITQAATISRGIPKTRHRGSSVGSAHHGYPVVKSYPIDSYRIYITWHKSPSYRTTILKQSISSIQIYPKIISRYHVRLFSFTSMKTYVT